MTAPQSRQEINLPSGRGNGQVRPQGQQNSDRQSQRKKPTNGDDQRSTSRGATSTSTSSRTDRARDEEPVGGIRLATPPPEPIYGNKQKPGRPGDEDGYEVRDSIGLPKGNPGWKKFLVSFFFVFLLSNTLFLLQAGMRNCCGQAKFDLDLTWEKQGDERRASFKTKVSNNVLLLIHYSTDNAIDNGSLQEHCRRVRSGCFEGGGVLSSPTLPLGPKGSGEEGAEEASGGAEEAIGAAPSLSGKHPYSIVFILLISLCLPAMCSDCLSHV